MATPRVSENPVVQDHYAAQLGISAAVAQVLAQLQIDFDSPDYIDVVAAIVREFQSASIALSVDYYTDVREFAGVSGAYRPTVIDPWSDVQITAYIDAALDGMTADIEAEVEALSQRLALDAGINQVFTAMDSDPASPRWARVARPTACSFCLMLAVRGAAYRSEESADFRAHVRYDGSGGVCQCGVEVSFTEYEPLAHIREMQTLYSEATADLPRGADRANAFRRALYAARKTSR